MRCRPISASSCRPGRGSVEDYGRPIRHWRHGYGICAIIDFHLFWHALAGWMAASWALSAPTTDHHQAAGRTTARAPYPIVGTCHMAVRASPRAAAQRRSADSLSAASAPSPGTRLSEPCWEGQRHRPGKRGSRNRKQQDSTSGNARFLSSETQMRRWGRRRPLPTTSHMLANAGEETILFCG